MYMLFTDSHKKLNNHIDCITYVILFILIKFCFNKMLNRLNLLRDINKMVRYRSITTTHITERLTSRIENSSDVTYTTDKQVKITSKTVDPKTLCLALESKPMKEWLTRMDNLQQHKHLNLHSVNVQSVDMFGDKVGFIKFVANVTDKDGDKCPGSVFMRGGSVAVLPILRTNFQTYVLLVQMMSVPTASYSLPSLPAGMIDDTGTFSGNMAREIEEETGMIINESELVDLTEKTHGDKFQGVYLSSGGTDEYVRLFYFERDVSEESVNMLKDKITGLAKENEKIKLTVVPFDKMCLYTSDAKALSAKALYDYHNNRF